jgi:hypothetical protein
MNLEERERGVGWIVDEQTAEWRDGAIRAALIEITSGECFSEDVCLTTEEFKAEYSVCSRTSADCTINLAATIKSLKQGPLGPAITLPGHQYKGQGYIVRIRGALNTALFYPP